MQIWAEDHDFSVTSSSLEFIENCSTSGIVRLLNYKPELIDTKYRSVDQEECFAETKYYDAEGRPFSHY